MNGAWTDAQTWLDILDHVWIGLVLIAVAVVPSWMAAKNGKGIKKISEQVVNGHTDPLRSDLDKVIATVESIDHGLHSLREELIHEETRRRSAIRELREDFDRRFIDMAQHFK